MLRGHKLNATKLLHSTPSNIKGTCGNFESLDLNFKYMKQFLFDIIKSRGNDIFCSK